MTMKILQMISKNDRYGAQRVFLDQVRILHEMGHHVAVVGRGDEGYVPESVRAFGVPYHGIAMKGIKDILWLRKFIKEQRFDIIHTALDRADHFGLLASFLTGTPVVSTCNVPRYHIGYKFASRVIVVSNKQKKILIKSGVKADKVVLIRPGIDVRRFSEPDPGKRDTWAQKLRIDQYSMVFCHIASIIERKAQNVSIELIAECKKRGENPLLVIIGDPLRGEYYDSLVRQITDLDLKNNVYFTGWTSEIPEILSLSHFTTLPSENEALGIVLMEGMVAGTPIIAREGEGGAELIEEYETGFLFKPSEGIGSLSERILKLYRDRAGFRELSEKCKAIGKDEFSSQRFGARLIDLYGTVLEGKKG